MTQHLFKFSEARYQKTLQPHIISIISVRNNINPRHSEYGISVIDVVLAATILIIGGAFSLSLITSSNDGLLIMNQHSRAQLGIASRIEEIRKEAFSLYCTSGCDENNLDDTLQYDEDAISDICINQNFGQKLLEQLQQNDPDLSTNFNIQLYDPQAPSLTITSSTSYDQNKLTVALTSNSTASRVTTTFVPNALGWCK